MDLDTSYMLSTTDTSNDRSIAIHHSATGQLVYHCTVHALPGTHVVYPVAVMASSPEHRKALPHIKLRVLVDNILKRYQVVLMSAGNETVGGRFSFQTQIQYAMSGSIHAYDLVGGEAVRFDDKDAFKAFMDRRWDEPLRLVLLSRWALASTTTYVIPRDYVHSLDQIDARAAQGVE